MELIPDKANFIDFLDAPTEFNPLKNDLQNLITDSGQTIGGNNFQFSKAVSGYSARATGYTDSGAANIYVLTPQAGFKAPHTYGNFMSARFKAANSNTGASTVNVASLGVVPIVNTDGTALNPFDITQNEYIELWYYAGSFILILSTGQAGTDSNTGEIVFFGGSQASRPGWLRCDGAQYLITTYNDLSSVIGTNWNNPAPSPGYFRVPDLRGRVPRGLDDGSNLDPGRLFGSYQNDELKSHYHTFTFAGDNGGSFVEPGGSNPGGQYATDGAGGVETRMKNAAARWWIKT